MCSPFNLSLLILSLLMTCILEAETSGLYRYQIEGNEIQILEYTGQESVVTVPDTIEGLPVTTVWRFSYLDTVTEVILSEGIKKIGGFAFNACRGLESISLPESLETIGGNAFHGCTSLKSIRIPEGVTRLEDGTVYGCSALTTIQLPSTLQYLGLNNLRNPALETIIIAPESPYYEVVDGAVYQKSTETLLFVPRNQSAALVVQAGTKRIERFALAECKNLAEVSLPIGLESIETAAFQNSGIVQLTVPEGVTYIGMQAFSGSKSLTEVSLPSTLFEMGHYVFRGCVNLQSVELAEGITEIPQGAFSHCRSLAEITIPASISLIESSAFWACSKLGQVFCKGDKPEYYEGVFPLWLPVVYCYDNTSGWGAEFDGAPVVTLISSGPWKDCHDLLNGWLQTFWYGLVSPQADNWTWSLQHGWQDRIGTSDGSYLVYDAALLSWVRTNIEIYPYLYIYGPGQGWYRFLYGTKDAGRWFEEVSTGETFLVPWY